MGGGRPGGSGSSGGGGGGGRGTVPLHLVEIRQRAGGEATHLGVGVAEQQLLEHQVGLARDQLLQALRLHVAARARPDAAQHVLRAARGVVDDRHVGRAQLLEHQIIAALRLHDVLPAKPSQVGQRA